MSFPQVIVKPQDFSLPYLQSVVVASMPLSFFLHLNSLPIDDQRLRSPPKILQSLDLILPKRISLLMENPTLRGRSMERVGYHTVAKLHAVWKTRTMSILSRRGAPENACSSARRRCPPAPLLLLSLSPSSSFISVRKTLSRCPPTMRARRQPPALPPIGIRIKKN